jgi:putative flippase GtrA
MSLSALLVFNITWQLYTLLGISTYIGQFISAALSTLWTFIGLRFWVFAPPRHHGLVPPRTPTTI